MAGTFRPDFLLVRQHMRDANADFRNLLLGFKYGGLPSVNSLHSIYNFQDKPWVLIQIQKRLGKENFPLTEQNYYPNHKEMRKPITY
uniref:Synapsin pre-ATP-grasp domain-containing protein n=1 Tax=Strigamia maritima TaxID=126957 RepID=T1IQA0_STRMM